MASRIRGARAPHHPDAAQKYRELKFLKGFGESWESYQDLANFLAQEDVNMEILARLLKDLDQSLLPEPFSDSRNSSSFQLVHSAMLSMARIANIFWSLSLARQQSPAIVGQMGRCLTKIRDCWQDILGWVRYLTVETPHREVDRRHFILQRCTNVLFGVLVNYHEARAKREILATASTVEVVLLLLCQVNRKTKQYEYMKRIAAPTGHCLISDVFAALGDTDEGREALGDCLFSLGRRDKKQVFEAIKGRCRLHASFEGEGITGAAMSQSHLVRGVIYITFTRTGFQQQVQLLRHGVLYECVASLSMLAHKLYKSTSVEPAVVQKHLGITSGSLRRLLSILLRGMPCAKLYQARICQKVVELGGFRCAMQCLVKADRAGSFDREAYEALHLMLPCFYLSKVYLAALDRGDVAEHFERQKSPLLGSKSRTIWEAFRVSLERNKETYGGKRDVTPGHLSMCSNVNVGCLNAFGASLYRSSDIGRIRQDQLTHLEVYANHSLPPLSERRNRNVWPKQTCCEDDPEGTAWIPAYEFSRIDGSTVSTNVSLIEHRTIEPGWNARFNQYLDDVRADPSSKRKYKEVPCRSATPDASLIAPNPTAPRPKNAPSSCLSPLPSALTGAADPLLFRRVTDRLFLMGHPWLTERARRLGQSAQIHRRAAKIDKLFENAGDGERGKLLALLEYLSTNFAQFDPMDAILDALDCARVPPVPMDSMDAMQTESVHDAFQAILNGISIFRSANLTPLPRNVEEYADRCYSRLLERWSDVLKWIFNLIMKSPDMTNRTTVLLICAELLRTISEGTNDKPYKEDIVTQHRTVDLVYLLLCQKERWGGRNCHVTETDMTIDCPISSLFHTYFLSTAGRAAAQGRLQNISRGTRDRIIRSILERSEELGSLTSDSSLDQAADRLGCLAAGVMCLVIRPDLWDAFNAQDFLYIQACSLSRLCENATAAGVKRHRFWETISDTIFVVSRTTTHILVSNPGSRIRRLVEGNFLEGAFQCLPHVGFSPSSGVYGALKYLLPYMSLSKVYEAVKGHVNLTRLLYAEGLSSKGRDILDGYRFIFGMNHYAFTQRTDTHVNMCTNRKVTFSVVRHFCFTDIDMCMINQHHIIGNTSPLSDDSNALKVCICRSVVYCSDECQQEDWIDFHSRECAPLLQNIMNASATKLGLHFAQSEIMSVNPDDRPFSEAVFSQPPFAVNKYRCHEDSAITKFDFLSKGRLATTLRFPLKLHLHDMWGHPSYGFLQPRIQRYVTDMEGNPNLVLAEGITQYDARQTILTFMILKYTAEAPEDRRYSVINAIFRMGDSSLLEDS
ncbi:hypothetical protein NMY22_g658 [Coprinellus aureogranulatus]|nr:hypothetical protein NMY22_g658 [Coprinellus aureogranulatus]